ncbi:MAG: WG repeat-containing protein [Bacteroidetes bacterium]|nr:WG repeat-containing protein [Bacteroidota bacterium]
MYPIIENEKYFSLIDISGKKVKGPFELVDECFYNDCSQGFGDYDLRTFDPYLKFKENNKIGIVNRQGEVVVRPINDTISDFGYSKKFYCVVSDKGMYGILDSGSTWRIEAKYKKLATSFQYANNESRLFFTCCIDSAWGLLDKDGKQIVPFIYDAPIERFGYTELWLLKKNGNFGLCNNKGVLVQDTIYSNILFKDDNGHYGVVETFDNRKGYITQEGKMFFGPRSSLMGRIVKRNMFDFFKGEYKIGLLDSAGKQIVPPVYDYMESLGDGVIVKQKNKWGMLNKNAKLLIPCLYDKISKVTEGKDDHIVYFIVEQKELYGVYNMKGKLIISVKYNEIGYRYIDGKFDFKLGNKCGIVNSKGVEIIKPQHDLIVNILNNSYIYTNNDKYGLGSFTDLPNTKKKMYDDVSKITTTKEVFHVRIDHKSGLIDSVGKTLLEPEYSYIKSIDDSYLWSRVYSEKIDSAYAKTLPMDYLQIEKDGKFAIYSVSKKWISNFDYEEMDYYKEGLLEVKKNGKKLLLDSDGKDVRNKSMFADDSYFEYKKDYWIVERKGKCGIIKRTGETVLPFDYDSISKLQRTYDRRLFGFVYKEGKTGIVNEHGELVVSPSDNKFFNNYINGAGAISYNGRIYAYFNNKGELIWKENKENYKSFRAPEFLLLL